MATPGARVISLVFLLLASTAIGEETRLVAGPGSAVVLEGSSNVKGWRCRSASVAAQMLVSASAEHLNEVIDRIEDGNIGVWMANPSAGRFDAPDFELRIPAATFRCGNRVMESDMQRALKSDQHPDVHFLFRDLNGGIRHDLDTGLYHAEVTGDLLLAGVKRTINLSVSAQRVSRTKFRLRAEIPLRMTDFGIKPPTALFGAVRARNRLSVHFDLVLEISAGRSQP